MRVYQDGSQVTLLVPLVDESGNALVPTSPMTVNFWVLDENDQEVQASRSVVVSAGSSDVTLAIDASANTLAETAKQGIRLVRLSMETATGIQLLAVPYVIEALNTLVELENSFQTQSRSLLTAFNMTDVDSFLAASEREQKRALMMAFEGLKRLSYRVTAGMDSLFWNRGETAIWIDELTDSEWGRLDDGFKQALRRAQVAEADYLLTVKQDQRAQGIVSETVGESSVTFREQKALNFAVSEKALRHLSGYVSYTVKTTRG